MGLGIGGILYTAGKKGGARDAQLLEKQFGFRGDQLLDAALIAFECGMEASGQSARNRAHGNWITTLPV